MLRNAYTHVFATAHASFASELYQAHLPFFCRHVIMSLMRQEDAFGVIPVRKVEEGYELLLVRHAKGDYWGFPKGRGEPLEEPQAAATRELYEETGLSIERFLPLPLFEESYPLKRGEQAAMKHVIYFAAEVTGDLTIQEDEIKEGRWVAPSSAAVLATFEGCKEIAREVQKWLA